MHDAASAVGTYDDAEDMVLRRDHLVTALCASTDPRALADAACGLVEVFQALDCPPLKAGNQWSAAGRATCRDAAGLLESGVGSALSAMFVVAQRANQP